MAAVPDSTTTTNLRDLAVARAQPAGGAVVQAGFFDSAGFELLQRASKMFASSSLVPEAYRGNVANCAIALNLARRLKADELMVMQNLYIVHGNPGWSAKFLIACVNTCGRFTTLRYEWKGERGTDDFGCRAWTIEKSTGERLNGVWIDWRMVKAEGWSKKSGSKWLTMDEQMFVYRSAAFWTRAYAPEISMGLSTVEELVDIVDVDPDGVVRVTTEELSSAMRDITPAAGETAQASGDTNGANGETKPANGETKTPSGETAGPGPTYAQVRDSLEKAKTLDELDDVASLIADIGGGKAQQKELNDLYGARRTALGG